MKKLHLKKTTFTTLITLATIIVIYIIMTILSSTGLLSYTMAGMLPQICVWIMMAVSLNLVVGVLGELSLGHAGFMYVGAFTGCVFIKITESTIPNEIVRFVLGMVIGAIFAAIFGLLIGSTVLRLQGDYLAIVTLAFCEVIKGILGTINLAFDSNGFHINITNANELTEAGIRAEDIIVKGSYGISKVPRVTTFTIGTILVIITVLIVLNLSDSRSGRAIKAVRDNKIAAETVGINISKYRLLAFTVAAAIAGVAGVLYAGCMGNLKPEWFDFNASIDVLVMVVLGGMGNIPGSIIATIVLKVLPEKIRFLGDYRMIIYAVVLIVMMIFSWNPKCIELRNRVSIKVKGVVAKIFKKNKKEVS